MRGKDERCLSRGPAAAVGHVERYDEGFAETAGIAVQTDIRVFKIRIGKAMAERKQHRLGGLLIIAVADVDAFPVFHRLASARKIAVAGYAQTG